MARTSILYIDDQYVNLFFFEEVFKELYDVKTASSGKDGLAMLEKHPEILIVITDIKMPEMDGLTFVAEARKRFDEKIYLVGTGMTMNDEIAQALESGLIDGYLSKPFEINKLAEAIKNAG